MAHSRCHWIWLVGLLVAACELNPQPDIPSARGPSDSQGNGKGGSSSTGGPNLDPGKESDAGDSTGIVNPGIDGGVPASEVPDAGIGGATQSGAMQSGGAAGAGAGLGGDAGHSGMAGTSGGAGAAGSLSSSAGAAGAAAGSAGQGGEGGSAGLTQP